MSEPGASQCEGFAEPRRSIQQFVDYLDMFARYKQTENLHSMGGIFDSNPQINPVERAMLGMPLCEALTWKLTMSGSLCPDTADEAKTLVPSLAPKFEDDALQPILDELQKLRKLGLLTPSDITQADFSARGSIWIRNFLMYNIMSWNDNERRHEFWRREAADEPSALVSFPWLQARESMHVNDRPY